MMSITLSLSANMGVWCNIEINIYQNFTDRDLVCLKFVTLMKSVTENHKLAIKFGSFLRKSFSLLK